MSESCALTVIGGPSVFNALVRTHDLRLTLLSHVITIKASRLAYLDIGNGVEFYSGLVVGTTIIIISNVLRLSHNTESVV